MADPRGERMRIDRFLWWSRLAKSRSAARDLAQAGTLRIDGRRIERAHVLVGPGAIIAFPKDGIVRVVRIDTLPQRRGPPAEARATYEELVTVDGKPVDAGHAPQ